MSGSVLAPSNGSESHGVAQLRRALNPSRPHRLPKVVETGGFRRTLPAWPRRGRRWSARRSSARRSPGSRTSRCTRRRTSRSTTSATSAIRASIPFTRGVYPSMYRGPPLDDAPVRRASARREETNERFRYLLEHGQTGLSTAFDMPTLMGYDSDHPRSLRRGRARGRRDRLARRHGDAVRRHPARRGLDLDDDQRAGGDAARVLRRASARSRACRSSALRGHDAERHPQGVHRAEGVDLPARAVDAAHRRHDRVLRAARCRGGTRSRSRGYHIREAGSTAAQELAFTLADGFAYVEAGIARGLDVDDFAPRLSFFFNAHIDFFEEIAKFRAARRIWATRAARQVRREGPALAG